MEEIINSKSSPAFSEISTIIGVIFFSEVPGLFSIFGASIIIITGYFNYRLNKTEEKEEIAV